VSTKPIRKKALNAFSSCQAVAFHRLTDGVEQMLHLSMGALVNMVGNAEVIQNAQWLAMQKLKFGPLLEEKLKHTENFSMLLQVFSIARTNSDRKQKTKNDSEEQEEQTARREFF
jgi:hypothetical protein